jgi:pilus assembly protein CpaD
MTKRLLLLASAGLSLGGCMGTQNRGVESVQQPVVSRQDYALDLRTAGGALASGEQARLAGWLDAMRVGYGDRVSVDDADGSSGARAEVGGVVAGYGLLLADEAPVSGAAPAPDAVRVIVSRMRADVPRCPDWSRPAEANFDQHTSSNFGCAVNRNLAAMVADPADLVRGRQGASATDPATAGKAIESFRKQTPTGAGSALKSESTGGR